MDTSAAKHKRKTSLHMIDSILSGFIVLYATYLIQNFTENKGFLVVLFLLMAAENAIRLNEGKRTKTQRFCVMAFYLVGAALILIIDPFHSSLLAAAGVELTVIVFNRVMAMIQKPKPRTILFNVACILIVIVVGLFCVAGDQVLSKTVQMEEAEMQANPGYTEISEQIGELEALDESMAGNVVDAILYIFLMLLILMRLILHVVGISISQMKLNILLNIIRETYVLEILLGLLLMIIACSSIMSTLEPNMENYGDALWYCFALVTTIGFGDISATTLVGRVLSVFLGIYGIVVVAIITSVIVNFYGEMKRNHADDQTE